MLVLPCPPCLAPLPLPSGVHKPTRNDLPAHECSVRVCSLACAVPGRTVAELGWHLSMPLQCQYQTMMGFQTYTPATRHRICHATELPVDMREGKAEPKDRRQWGCLRMSQVKRTSLSPSQRDCCSPRAADATRTALTQAGVQCMAKERGVPAVGCWEWRPSTHSQ